MLYWNTCGIGNKGIVSHLSYLVRLYKLNLVAITEPKISGDNAPRTCRRLGFECWHREEAQGLSRGLWVLWNKSNFKIQVLVSNPQFIHMEINQINGESWLCTVVYRNPNGMLGRNFWQESADLANNIQGPWLVLGDFNVIISSNECIRRF